MPIAQVLKNANLTVSTSEAGRMVKQGAVKINSEKITDQHFLLEKNTRAIVQVGKHRFADISLV